MEQKQHNCETCKMRAKYDSSPKSLLGRFWRWHANWCPGWKAYMLSLPDDRKTEMIDKYKFKKTFQN